MDFARKSDALGLVVFTSVEIISPIGSASQAFWWLQPTQMAKSPKMFFKYMFLLRN